MRSAHLAQALSELVEVVQCSTDREAINMGIWMHETLSLLARWRVRATHSLSRCHNEYQCR